MNRQEYPEIIALTPRPRRPMGVRSLLGEYVLAIASVALATLVRRMLDPVLGNSIPYATYFVAILFVASFASLWPAIVALLLGAWAVNYFFFEPRGSWFFHFRSGADWVSFTLYTLVGVSVIGLNEAVRRARRWEAAHLEALRVTLSSIGDAVIATDAPANTNEARVIFMNLTAERMTGWTQHEASGKFVHEIFKIVNEKTHQPVESPVSKALRTGMVIGLANHTVLISRDGGETPIDDSAAPIRDDAGRNMGVVMVFHDISERRAAERAIEESERRRRIALESAGIGSWNLDPTTSVLETDEQFRILFHGSTDPITYEQSISAVHPDDRQRVRDAVAKALKPDGPAPYSEEYRIVHPNGMVRWISGKGRANFRTTPDGQQIASLDGTVTDITDRMGAELVKSELAAIVESSDDAIISKDLNGIIKTWNAGAQRLFGYTAFEAIGKSITILIPPDRLNEEPGILDRIRRGERIDHYETIRRRKDGALVSISLTVSPMIDAHGRIVGASKIARDITGRKQNEQAVRDARDAAEAANRAKDMFLATLSHEMRTPLSAIIGWVSLLQRAHESGEARDEQLLAEGLDVIARNTKAQVQLIEDVLDVSRIVSGKLRLDIRPCDLVEAIKAGIDSVRTAADAREITLNVHLDPDAGRSSCDATRVQQIIWNLVSNAVKFTPKRGTVTISLSREQSGSVVRVSDTGQGISADLLPFVFDRFRQADSSSRRNYGGLGLGLSIVKHLVEAHGGTVEAQSEGEGKGSTFTVRLPIKAIRIDEETSGVSQRTSSDGPSSGAAPAVRIDGLRVLVVDDEADARRLLVKVLESAGAIVTAAKNADDALEQLRHEQPEILVSDLGMPGRDGFDLIREVRAGREGQKRYHPRDLPAVALTAFAHEDDQRRALLAGFQVHVPKPVDPHDLTAVIASLAGRTGLV